MLSPNILPIEPKHYWWVNHKQTFKKEFEGGYIWSPKKNKDGRSNQTYINLTIAEPGDVIFSYASGAISLVGVITSKFVEASVPTEFGKTGNQWDTDGYLVKVEWTKLSNPLSPKQNILQIKHLLPSKYSPIQQSGDGNQGIYLSAISFDLAETLLSIISKNDLYISDNLKEISASIEIANELEIISNEQLPETEKEQLVKARLGQGIFKSRVLEIEKKCRITGINDKRFLIASHIQPWSKSNNFERLDGNNGLCLSPHVDKLFDNGFISFTNNGDILVSSKTVEEVLTSWNLSLANVGSFSKQQIKYLEFHRGRIFKS